MGAQINTASINEDCLYGCLAQVNKLLCIACTGEGENDQGERFMSEEKKVYMLSGIGRGIFTFALMAVFAIPGQAIAQNQQDYCIKCSNPDETYICRIVSNSNSARGKQLFCIMNIAKEQGHDSCAATTQSQSCSGVLVQYEVSGMPIDPAPAPTTHSNLATTDENTPLPKAADEPRTLVEFTKKATKATKTGIKSAGKDTSKALKNTGKAIEKTGKNITKFTQKVGKNITKATKTTWKCITSLFFSCD